MKCVRCKVGDTMVTDSRPEADGFQVKRARKCKDCGHRFFTYESTYDPAVRRAARIRQRARHRKRQSKQRAEYAKAYRAAKLLGVKPAEVRAAWAEEKDRV